MKRKANAIWNGSGKDGQGKLATESGVLQDTQYSWKTRFADGKGTNPEELIAAAHAGCFSMALAFALGKNGHEAKEIRTEAVLSFEQQDAGFAITAVHLDLTASDSRHRRGRLPQDRRRGQERLPGVQGAEGADHARRQARRLTHSPLIPAKAGIRI